MSESMKDIKEAIKHFEYVKNDAIAVLDSGFGTKPNENNILYKKRKLYAELAINALEKQIPKKAIPIFDNRCDTTRVISYMCPTCETMDLGNNEYRFNCCEECGQKLEWGELKE